MMHSQDREANTAASGDDTAEVNVKDFVCHADESRLYLVRNGSHWRV